MKDPLWKYKWVQQNEPEIFAKVYKWLDTDDIRTYEQFISDWHYFLKALQERIAGMEDQAQIRSICMYVLQQFYLAPCEDFYEAFHGRLDEAKRYFEM